MISFQATVLFSLSLASFVSALPTPQAEEDAFCSAVDATGMTDALMAQLATIAGSTTPSTASQTEKDSYFTSLSAWCIASYSDCARQACTLGAATVYNNVADVPLAVVDPVPAVAPVTPHPNYHVEPHKPGQMVPRDDCAYCTAIRSIANTIIATVATARLGSNPTAQAAANAAIQAGLNILEDKATQALTEVLEAIFPIPDPLAQPQVAAPPPAPAAGAPAAADPQASPDESDGSDDGASSEDMADTNTQTVDSTADDYGTEFGGSGGSYESGGGYEGGGSYEGGGGFDGGDSFGGDSFGDGWGDGGGGGGGGSGGHYAIAAY